MTPLVAIPASTSVVMPFAGMTMSRSVLKNAEGQRAIDNPFIKVLTHLEPDRAIVALPPCPDRTGWRSLNECEGRRLAFRHLDGCRDASRRTRIATIVRARRDREGERHVRTNTVQRNAARTIVLDDFGALAVFVLGSLDREVSFWTRRLLRLLTITLSCRVAMLCARS